jgi:SAM-dependent MidA family methyltransferase
MSSAPADSGSGALLQRLRERIGRDGPMPVDCYMQACVGDPEHGYWQRAATIGARGDFITAPEISQVFGELIGLWCAVAWQGMGQPAPLRLIELGPGRGVLMRDALRAARAVPGFLDAARVHLVEVSAPLREAQRRTLLPPPSRVRDGEGGMAEQSPLGFPPPLAPPRKGEGNAPAIAWHDTLGDVPPGPAIVVANEFLDALPIRQLVYHDGAWRERVVDLGEGGGLRFAMGADVPHASATPPPPGAVAELRAGEDQLLAALAARAAPLVALFIDYGPAEPSFGDTLQAVRHHAYADPLAEPGLADLTAHVQFAGLAEKARAAGLATDGPVTQAEFLGRLGSAERAARLMAANPARAGEIEAAVQRLVSPTGMGQLFKVLAVRFPALPPPVPFG